MKTFYRIIDIKALVAGMFPVILGSVYSLYRFDRMNRLDMMVLTLAIILLQSSANMLNELFAYHRRKVNGQLDMDGAPSDEVVHRNVKVTVVLFLLIDLVVGTYYGMTHHWGIVAVGAMAVLIMYFYSAGDRPISHTPFGEFVAGATTGFGIMTTVIYIQSGVVDLETVMVALPTSIYIGTILLTNNISDHHEDRQIGRKTLPIHIGIHWAELLWIVSCHSLLTFTAFFVFVGYWPVESLVLALVLFPFRPIYRFRGIPKEAENKDRLMALVGRIGVRYHVAVIAGIIISRLH